MGNSDFKRRIELKAQERREMLEGLDANPEPEATQRSRKRYDYQVPDIPLCIEHPQGGESRFLVYGRNISRGGIAILHGGFVHSGSKCRLVLRTIDGEPLVVSGAVRQCRLVGGSIHEVGIEFGEEIDPALVDGSAVCEEKKRERSTSGLALSGVVLLAESFEPERLLLQRQLSMLGAEVQSVATPGAVLDAVRRSNVDLVLSGLSVVSEDGLHTIRRLREMSYAGPVVMLTAETDPMLLGQARQAGTTSIVSKPIGIDLLVAQLKVHLHGQPPPKHLFSTAEDQPVVRELLGSYVSSVRMTADQIDKAHQEGDTARLRELCFRLKSTGCGYGFLDLTVAAMCALNAVDLRAAADAQREMIEALVACGRSLESTPAAA